VLLIEVILSGVIKIEENIWCQVPATQLFPHSQSARPYPAYVPVVKISNGGFKSKQNCQAGKSAIRWWYHCDFDVKG